MKVLLHESWPDVQSLSENWNLLLAESASNTIFLTWEWVESWWKNYGANRPLFVLSVWQDELLQGIAPFYLEAVSRWGAKWNFLKLIGDGSHDSDYLDCIVRKGCEDEVITAIVRFLDSHRTRWDCLELHGTPEGSPCLKVLVNLAIESAWRFSSESIPCASLPLPQSWNDYLKLLKPRFRTKVRSTLAYFDTKIGTSPIPCEDATELDTWLPILFDLHTRRWGTRNRPGVFRDSAKQLFYRDVSQSSLRRGWLAFHRLDWGERTLAMQYGFKYNNRFFLLQEGYDPEFAAVRPGLALRGQLIRHWISAGLAEYDFLAGASSYKLEWGGQLKQSLRWTLAPSRHAAWVSFGESHAKEKAKAAVRSVIPERLLEWRAKPRDPQNQVSTVAVSDNGHARSVIRRAAEVLYTTPLAALGRAVASRYEFGPSRQLRRRTAAICQIFIFHRVNDDFDPFLPSVPIAAFRKQMEFLKRNFPIISMDEIGRGSFPPNEKYCAAVTFDDGYRDNFTCAFPVLKNLGMPASIFLTTGSIESGEMSWYDQVSWAFKLTMQPNALLSTFGGPDLSLEKHSDRVQSMGKTLGWLRALSEIERMNTLPHVFRVLHVPMPLSVPKPMLDWDEIRQMSKQGISFGAHTVSHPALSRISKDRLEAEIVESKTKIENELQMPVNHFAYPFGQPSDIGPDAKLAVQRAGFQTAVTTTWGFNRPGDDLFGLKRFSPRFNPWDFDPGRFAMMLDWYRFAGVIQQGHNQPGS